MAFYISAYTEELLSLKYGHPMWAPHKPTPPIQIGDVGYIDTQHGDFVRLFNATRPEGVDNPEVPDNFKMLDLSTIDGVHLVDDPYFIQDRLLSSKSTSKDAKTVELSMESGVSGGLGPELSATVGYKYTGSGQRGALLFLGSEGHKTAYRDNSILRNYVAKNCESWGKLAERKGLLAGGPFDGPIFVNGFIKTTYWEIAVWSEAGESVEVCVGVGAAKFGKSSVLYAHEGSLSPGISHHWGPPVESRIWSSPKSPARYWKRTKGAMGPHRPPNADRSPRTSPQLMVDNSESDGSEYQVEQCPPGFVEVR
ncbi:hypothetical protein NLI96_g11884 [Meripilus lineatus]|uniref:Uncharacterized protein n=1 Tax=Meripilus lineatus TaxID=2056292 RepID=A0AAD5YAF7_9APHY|nr:hypothetical protein NLI96_g11884 [Physisporinus lineatus]